MKTESIYKSAEGAAAIMALYDAVLARWPVPHEFLYVPTRHGATFVVASGDPAAAPLVLLRAGLEPVLTVRRLALRTRRVIKQNLGWALGYNLLLVPLAALGQLERFGGPMLAGAAMGLSSLTVVLNALRLRR